MDQRASDIVGFDEMLAIAEEVARTGWEVDFVESLRAKYDEWGEDMFVSEKQLQVLDDMIHHIIHQ